MTALAHQAQDESRTIPQMNDDSSTNICPSMLFVSMEEMQRLPALDPPSPETLQGRNPLVSFSSDDSSGVRADGSKA
jgi:hypothetical protein